MSFTKTWDETKPAGTRAINLGDDDIREFKFAVRERLQFGGMYFPSSHDELAGEYNYLRFAEQSSNPTVTADKGFLFTKDSSGITELYWMDSGGNVVQLTFGGRILISSLAITGQTRGDVLRMGASLWERLSLGAARQVLKSDGTDVVWGNDADSVLTTQGDVLYRDGSALARLPAGTSGQLLKTLGAGANPAWAWGLEIVTGSYTGNGSDGRSITIGFSDTSKTPKLVFVTMDGSAPHLRTDSFVGDQSLIFSTFGWTTNRIQGFSANAFEVGNDTDINGNGTTYRFFAIG